MEHKDHLQEQISGETCSIFQLRNMKNLLG